MPEELFMSHQKMDNMNENRKCRLFRDKVEMANHRISWCYTNCDNIDSEVESLSTGNRARDWNLTILTIVIFTNHNLSYETNKNSQRIWYRNGSPNPD